MNTKFIIFLFSILVSGTSLAQYSYFSGERTGTVRNGDSIKETLIGYITSTKDSRSWTIHRCDTDNKCLDYKLSLKKTPGGKWVFELPSPEKVKAPASTDGDGITMKSFKTSWTDEANVPCCTFEQKTDKENTIWTFVSTRPGKKSVLVTRLKPITKQQYDAVMSKL